VRWSARPRQWFSRKDTTHGGPRPVCTAGGPGRTQVADVDDRIRQAAQTIYQALIEAELTAVIGAAPHQRTPERLAQRNGHRPRPLATTAGDLELRIPKLRAGSFFPSLVERPRRVDQALFAVVMEAYLHGSPPARSTTWPGLGCRQRHQQERGQPDLRRPGRRSERVPGPVAGRPGLPYVLSTRPIARPGSTGGSSPKPWWPPPGCAATAAARSSALGLATARTEPSGPRSCGR
jgi:hypothetical protein